MKSAVVSGYYGFDNFGDDAVLKVLVEGLREKYTLTVLSANPKKTMNSYKVKSVYSFDYLEVIKTISDSQLFISGGGSLLQDVTSFKSLLYYLLLLYFAILLRKDVVIFAQGIGPLKSKLSSFLVRYALKSAKVVTVRDKVSEELLKSWGITSILVDDPVFSLQISNAEKQKNTVGIQLRSFAGLNEKALESLANFVNETFCDKKIVLYSLQDAIDLEICQKFAKFLKFESVEIKYNLEIDDVIKELSTLETLIAMRFHAVLIALRAGVRVLPIVYDKKVRILSETAGLDFVELESLQGGTEHLDKCLKRLENIDVDVIQNKFKNKNFDFSLFDDI